jgi:mannitol/fructose-specific phosphotransferase system IIA component (Ntr-type)
LVGERTVLVARSSKGVDFDAVDENPVRLLFLIAAPPIERDPIYLKLLAEIVRAVRLVKVRQRILDAPDFDTIREVLANAAAD